MTLSQEQERLLAQVLDTLVPPSDDGRLPGAGELGVVEYVTQLLEPKPESLSMIAAGLDALRDRTESDFGALDPSARAELLQGLGASHPGFVGPLVFYTYSGYYQNPQVLEALGLEGRPPYPQGYELPERDLTLLDDVRRRPKLYREV